MKKNSFQIGVMAVDLLVDMMHRHERGIPSIPYRLMVDLSLETVENCLRTVAKVSLDNEKYFCDLDGEMGDADFGKTLADGSGLYFVNSMEKSIVPRLERS